MITISGRDIKRDNHEAPSMYDVGYHLSKQPRFGGATVKHWTVLHHLYAALIYASDWHPKNPKLHLHAFLHDAHECITGDVPQPWKTDDLRALQKDLDERIFRSLKISSPDLVTERMVKYIDDQLVYQEALVYAPQVVKAILVPGPNYREVNPNDSRGAEAVREAANFLSTKVFNPDWCGKAYEAIIKEVINADQRVPTGDPGVGQADGLERRSGLPDPSSPDALRAVGGLGGVSEQA